MSNILFTWDMGSNLGHLSRHLPIARVLRHRGHEVLFAIREWKAFKTTIAQEGFSSIQAPFFFDKEAVSRELLNYADILTTNGFGSSKQLSGLMDGWSSLFRKFSPDMIISQFAPSSLLAAHLNGIPAVRVDCGFGSPPDDSPFPCFRPWLNVTRDELLLRENLVLNQINSICRKKRVSTFTALQDVFSSCTSFLLTSPELDHYTGRRNGNYIGPIFNLEEGAEIEWPEGTGPRVFVYLRQFEWLPAILQLLSARGCSVVAFLPGAGDNLRAVFTSKSFRISTTPVRLAGLLPSADILITHAGHGLASASLLAGVPMLLVPQMAEQLMTVYNFERLGIGRGVRHDEVKTKFAQAFNRMMNDSSYRENAKRLSLKYAGYDQNKTVMTVCDAIEDK